jgi:hypothetical protein
MSFIVANVTVAYCVATVVGSALLIALDALRA